ncbi:hypothetical protein ACFX15_007362 [Malus domestica]
MIPAACGDNVQKKQAEKNAARTINPAQGVRAEELEKLPHLLGEQIRTNTFASCLPAVQKKQAEKNADCTLIFPAQNSKPVQEQSCGKSTRSTISKTRFAFLNSTLSGFTLPYLSCLFVVYYLLVFLCEYMLETLRTMFDLSVGDHCFA